MSSQGAIYDMHNRDFISRKHFHTSQLSHDQPPLRSKSKNPDAQSLAHITNSTQTVKYKAVSPYCFSYCFFIEPTDSEQGLLLFLRRPENSEDEPRIVWKVGTHEETSALVVTTEFIEELLFDTCRRRFV